MLGARRSYTPNARPRPLRHVCCVLCVDVCVAHALFSLLSPSSPTPPLPSSVPPPLPTNHHNHHPRLNQVCPFLVSSSFVPFAVDIMDVDSAATRGGTGSARRRRERRLRQHWRHEQLTLQMLLATYQHHAAPRGQMTARSVEWGSELNYTAAIRRTPPPLPQAAGAQHFAMDVDEVLAAGGSRPDRLAPVSGPQERVLRHTVEQAGDVVPGLPALDALVPQMVDKLEDVLKIVDLFVPAQEIEVPRISSPSCPPPRRVLPVPQLAEQLVDVPLPAAGVVRAGVYGLRCQWPGLVTHLGLHGTNLLAPGHRPRPVEHRAGDHRQPRAVHKYWARMRISTASCTWQLFVRCWFA